MSFSWLKLSTLLLVLVAFLTCCYCEGEPGKPCDPAFYDKYVKPVSDAAGALYKVLGTGAEKSASATLSSVIHKSEADLASQISVPPKTVDPSNYVSLQKTMLMNKNGCLGLKAPYLTCDKERRVCKCRTTFPFASNETAAGPPKNETGLPAQCVVKVGSVCGIDEGVQLSCDNDTLCAKEGISKARFCGGLAEFKKKQKENGSNLGVNMSDASANYMPIIILSAIVSLLGAD